MARSKALLKDLVKSGTDKPTADAKKPRKKRRRKIVKSEIRRLQRSTETLNTRASFERVVRDILKDATDASMNLAPGAIDALQSAAEAAVTEAFDRSNRIALQCASRVGVMKQDFLAVTDYMRHFQKQ